MVGIVSVQLKISSLRSITKALAERSELTTTLSVIGHNTQDVGPRGRRLGSKRYQEISFCDRKRSCPGESTKPDWLVTELICDR